jgi:hypothetical protein
MEGNGSGAGLRCSPDPMSEVPCFAESESSPIGASKYPSRGLPFGDRILGFLQCGPDGSSPGAGAGSGAGWLAHARFVNIVRERPARVLWGRGGTGWSS